MTIQQSTRMGDTWMIPQINGTMEQNIGINLGDWRTITYCCWYHLSSGNEKQQYTIWFSVYIREEWWCYCCCWICLIDIWYMSWYKYKLGKMTYQNKYNKFQNLSCEPPKREPSATQQSSNIRVHCMISFEGIWFMIKTNKRYVVIWSKEIRNKV